MTWNVNGQLTGGDDIVYSSTQNNGQITQAVDTLRVKRSATNMTH